MFFIGKCTSAPIRACLSLRGEKTFRASDQKKPQEVFFSYTFKLEASSLGEGYKTVYKIPSGEQQIDCTKAQADRHLFCSYTCMCKYMAFLYRARFWTFFIIYAHTNLSSSLRRYLVLFKFRIKRCSDKP